jgi:3-oxoacyl-[acyl-carrier-protein] synthase II
VPGEARSLKIDRVLKNSFGFGGHNACLVLGKAA